MEQKNLDIIRKLFDISRWSKSKRHSKNINPWGIMENLKSHSKQPQGLKTSLLCKMITLENAESFQVFDLLSKFLSQNLWEMLLWRNDKFKTF